MTSFVLAFAAPQAMRAGSPWPLLALLGFSLLTILPAACGTFISGLFPRFLSLLLTGRT
jgi:hypothetical protein